MLNKLSLRGKDTFVPPPKKNSLKNWWKKLSKNKGVLKHLVRPLHYYYQYMYSYTGVDP